MHPVTKQFIEVLTADVNRWEGAAKCIDELVPNLRSTDVEEWKATANRYREYAAEYKALIEWAKKDGGVN